MCQPPCLRKVRPVHSPLRSWSKTGRLLASGSDDHSLVIHAYQPESSTTPFLLSTKLDTGHTQNIFSVKFMPHSNDNTVVTAAGDAEVRVFDLEYSGRPGGYFTASSTAARTGSLGTQSVGDTFMGGRFLIHGNNTNTRVYRSHTDRVKRIVTESSPYLFLTCAEDGEVRQFDTRLPSSAYPGGARRSRFRRFAADGENADAPPPLISYKRYRVDLNTISCSPSQPHYIMLGGAHLHCFLHDRRMTGRDLLAERGSPGLASSSSEEFRSDRADDDMGEATKCVRRFAPNGKEKMGRSENGHVTACKISDAHPNQAIASWSGDDIYSFDLVKSSDARDQSARGTEAGKGKTRVKDSGSRKRKRKQEGSAISTEGQRRGGSRPRHSVLPTTSNDVVLRLRYENGQSEDISIEQSTGERMIEQSRESVLNDSQRRSMRIAKSVVKIRKLMFSLEASTRDESHNSNTLSTHIPSFTHILGSSAGLLPEMDDIIRGWAYPVAPSSQEVAFHATLRQHRDSSRRFVQACGTLARSLKGRLQTAGGTSDTASANFDMIKSSNLEGPLREIGESFRYSFLKAILLWLHGGRDALLKGFKKSPSTPGRLDDFFPVPDDAADSGIEEFLIPMLVQLASETKRKAPNQTSQPITNVDASRFETDEKRYLFTDEGAAVTSFSNAIKIPLKHVAKDSAFQTGEEGTETSRGNVEAQDQQVALKYWAFRVGRGLLMNAGEGVNFALVDRAYGGLGIPRNVDEGRVQDNIDPYSEDKVMAHGAVMPKVQSTAEDDQQDLGTGEESNRSNEGSAATPSRVVTESFGDKGNLDIEEDGEEIEDEEEQEEEEEEEEEDEDGDGDSDEDAEEDEIDEELTDQFFFRSSSERHRLRSQVQKHVPASSHTRKYSGHCNVKTVKDVNFFGLDDEYVVSGCDSGHLFVWDRKTTRLLNILKGDGEVVNVVQGN